MAASTERMRCIEIAAPGGPEALRLAERPIPAPGPGEVLIRVEAAGVNRPDVMQRMGHYDPPPGASDLPGLEVAGRIGDLGEGVTAFAVGDAVCALAAGGGYAEWCVVPAVQALPIPKGLSMAEAAGVPETAFTVWHNVFERGRLAPGETLLVHGGTSGIGVMTIQLARALGARVFATAGTPEKARACEGLGAERGIDYRAEDFVAVVKDATGGRGVNVVLDMVGGDYVARNLDALAPEGRCVSIAALRGPKATINILPILLKRLTLTGSTLRARPVEEKGRIARAVHDHVWQLLESGAVRPMVHATFPLEDAAKAHRLMETSAHVGKIVLMVARSR